MALSAIVPCDRKRTALAEPQLCLLLPSSVPTNLAPAPDDLHALAAELVLDEGLSPVEAISQALALQENLLAFAALWDVDAGLAGHPHTLTSSLIFEAWPALNLVD